MNDEVKNYEELEKELLDRMKARGYSQVTITGYRYLCNSVIHQMKHNGNSSYTKAGGNKVLEDYLKINGKNQYFKNLRTVINRLNDLLDDTWIDVHSSRATRFDLTFHQKTLVDNYCNYYASLGRADGTVKLKRYAIQMFFSKLNEIYCSDIAHISAETISKACVRISDYNLWGETRVFLRYLSDVKILSVDYSTIVPHFRKQYVLPTVYSIDEVQKLESVIDTNTELGLRDYAMILLASRLGMRSGDIVLLKNEKINFINDEILLIQQKTKMKLNLPLLPEIKAALQNYLAVRTGYNRDFIFLNVNAPYHPVTTGTMRHAVTKYLSMAGIDISSKRHGPHALRSSLASSMVNDKVPYEVVRKVLGHSSNNAIKHYARIDIENLRNYSLEPYKVSGDFQRFLYGEGQVNEQ